MAQLDNAAESDSEERGFKSLWAGQKKNKHAMVFVLFYFFVNNLHPTIVITETTTHPSPNEYQGRY